MRKSKERRRQIIVDKTLQRRIVLDAAWPSALCLGATSLLLGVFCARLHNEALEVEAELPSVLPVFAACVLFTLVATGFIGYAAVRLSHRVAGPIYNLGKTLERFRAGDDQARVRFRKRDYLHDAADHVNELLAWIETNRPAPEKEEQPASKTETATATETETPAPPTPCETT